MFHSFPLLTLDGADCPASRSGRLTVGKSSARPVAHLIEGCVGPRAGLNRLGMEYKSLPLVRIEQLLLRHLARIIDIMFIVTKIPYYYYYYYLLFLDSLLTYIL